MSLEPFVQFEEQYASHALNRKMAGVFPPGVYRGFRLSVVDSSTVEVGHGSDSVSGAVVERNGYSITLRETATQELTVPPSDGTYHVVLEADYTIGVEAPDSVTSSDIDSALER